MKLFEVDYLKNLSHIFVWLYLLFRYKSTHIQDCLSKTLKSYTRLFNLEETIWQINPTNRCALTSEDSERVFRNWKWNLGKQVFLLRSLSYDRVKLHCILEHLDCLYKILVLLHQQTSEKVWYSRASIWFHKPIDDSKFFIWILSNMVRQN